MNDIGGYFELELRRGTEYHNNAIRLNTGRNALALILLTRKYSKVYIPYYICDVILEPFKNLHVNYEFYPIDNNFEPIFNYNLLKTDESFLYTNYFGLKDNYVFKLSGFCKNLIIDNSQAFYTKNIKDIDTFYSARKFFGVPDGAYLYLKDADTSGLTIDVSLERFVHLIKRIEYGAEVGYNDFKENDQKLSGQPIMLMSNLTKAILCNIDYEFIKKRRRENFLFLQKHLSEFNKLEISMEEESVPMVYPFFTDKPELKHILIENKIFVATYWPNVLEWTQIDSIEYKNVTNIIHLPIDQRFDEREMKQIVSKINYVK